MQIQQRKDQENGCEPGAVNNEQRPRLWGVHSSAAVEHRNEKEFQRVHIEQHEEQQQAVEEYAPGVLQSITPEETIVVEPQVGEQGKADAKGPKTPQGLHECLKAPGNFEGNYQQRNCEGEDSIRKPFQTGYLPAPPPEASLSPQAASGQMLTYHDILSGLHQYAPR